MRVPALLQTDALCLLPAARAQAESFRCGNRSVAEGSSRAELLLKCGEPFARETRTETYEVKVKDSVGHGDSVSATRTVTVTWDEWTYNFGKHDFVRVVVFRDGKLFDVRTGDYGQ